METPKLIEPGVSYFFNNILKSCHETNINYKNFIVNISLLCFFITFSYILLKYKKDNRTTNEEKTKKEKKKNEYIINKLKMFNHNKLKQHNELITDLPNLKYF
jgi:hypothetical protein